MTHHQIGLGFGTVMPKHGMWMLDEAEIVRGDVRVKQPGKSSKNGLVPVSRGRRHEQLPAHKLVLVPVVGETMQVA